ncbi:hypothetical protein [Nostoc sp. FACHB-110]|uniref:hypothetical protein n=1 Tax=Nostoc sp. FACHB-110 TaxID=2692834 RepID=UPI001682B388|nr:hypothetical protein [Nostoc sp. FACHB-110]MBD2439470.1 hypothetical protein [Nostoc sp. FACHB-110]
MTRNRLTKTAYHHDPFIHQFFASIPPQTAATFTEIQLWKIKQAFKHKFANSHSVDIRFFIPLPKKRFSLVLVFAQAKRYKKRLQYPIYRHINRVVVTKSGLLVITSLMGTLCMVEIVPSIKDCLGMDKRYALMQALNGEEEITFHHRKH